MIRRPPRSTRDRSSAASDVYKRRAIGRANEQLIEAVTVTGPGRADRLAGAVAGCRTVKTQAGGRAERRQIDGRAKARPAKDGVGAVSYTHLRAHETGLDLVCRLLLEKKNNINT